MTLDEELRNVLIKYPGGLQVSVNPVAMQELTALIERQRADELKKALTIVEEKNDVQILNWFDQRLSELTKASQNKDKQNKKGK